MRIQPDDQGPMNLPRSGEYEESTLPDATPPAGLLASNVARASPQTLLLHAQTLTGNVASHGVSVGTAASNIRRKAVAHWMVLGWFGCLDSFCVVGSG